MVLSVRFYGESQRSQLTYFSSKRGLFNVFSCTFVIYKRRIIYTKLKKNTKIFVYVTRKHYTFFMTLVY